MTQQDDDTRTSIALADGQRGRAALALVQRFNPNRHPALCGRCRHSLNETCVTECAPAGLFRSFEWDRDRWPAFELRARMLDDDLLDPRLNLHGRVALLCLHEMVRCACEGGR